MKRKLGIVASCLRSEPQIESLSKIKAAGFDGFFTSRGDIAECCAMREKADSLGLEYQFIHAPYKGINTFWTPGLDYLPLYTQCIESVDAAAAAGVPTVVMHVSSGWTPPQLCDIGFARFDSFVEYAIKRGVKIAFENLRTLGTLAAIMDRYARVENVGFCFDNGHEHCRAPRVKFIDLYAERILCTHIHDNPGRDPIDPTVNNDLHLLPFDGTYDFQDMMDRMNKYGYEGALTLELGRQEPYADMADEDWLLMCYERLKKISEM